MITNISKIEWSTQTNSYTIHPQSTTFNMNLQNITEAYILIAIAFHMGLVVITSRKICLLIFFFEYIETIVK